MCMKIKCTMSDSDEKNNNGPSEEVPTHRKCSEKKNENMSIEPTDSSFHPQTRWPDLCAQLFLHAGAVYGLIFQLYAIKFVTLIWCK